MAETMQAVEIGRWRHKYGTHEAQTTLLNPSPKVSWKMSVVDYLLVPLFFGSHIIFRNRLRKTFENRLEQISQVKLLFESLLLQWVGKSFFLVPFNIVLTMT